jgi:CDP-glycerol glycerophosphotransferase (TagB/SpsB family)
MSFRTTAWAKHVPGYMRYVGMIRFFTVGLAMKLLFRVLEMLHAAAAKDCMLFVLPYEEYDENTKFLFEHALRHGGPLVPVLFVYHDELHARLRKRFPRNIVLAKSREGWRAFFRAKLAFTSRGAMMNAFYPYVFDRRYKFFVNLWHGIPLKRIGFLARDSWESLMRLEVQRYAAMTVCSSAEQFTMALSNAMSIDDVWITNTPRNDPLFQRAGRARRAGAVVLYAPTYRDGAANAALFPFPDFDAAALAAFLERHDCRLIVRRHVLEKTVPPSFAAHPRIVMDDRETLYDSLADELLDTDVLITDYSSIYLDYLALGRPILFVPYDIAQYDRKRGLMYDYETVTPGRKALTFQQMLSGLGDYLREPRLDEERRRKATDFFHLHQDGQACRRILARAQEALAGNAAMGVYDRAVRPN